MKHSSRQLAREEEFARQNQEYLDAKRAELKSLAPNDEAEPKKRGSSYQYCCLGIAIILLLSAGLIYYFVVNVKDSVYQGYLDGKVKLEDVLPQGKTELTNSLDQGQQLIDQTKGNVQTVENKVDAAKDVYNQASSAYKKVNELINGANTLK